MLSNETIINDLTLLKQYLQVPTHPVPSKEIYKKLELVVDGCLAEHAGEVEQDLDWAHLHDSIEDSILSNLTDDAAAEMLILAVVVQAYIEDEVPVIYNQILHQVFLNPQITTVPVSYQDLPFQG